MKKNQQSAISNQQSLANMRHSCSHLLAMAVLKLYPKAKLGIGPVIENGFYYDFDLPQKISDKDLPKIEKEMKKIKENNFTFVKKEVSTEEAKKIFKDQPYKIELIKKQSATNQPLTIYQSDKFVDLCKGPHINNSSQIGPFKLLSVAGAYWHGDEKNQMLTRIYGTCFPTQKELNHYIWQVGEAKKRDHRVLGKKLDLFVISNDIGKGLPMLTPKGTIIRKQILDYEYQLEKEAGFMHVSCPHIAKSEMYKKTDHWQHYREVMYAPFGIEAEEYVLKPMNCPHHYMIFKSKPRSYRDLPWRVAEAGTCYRFEKTGELSGLLRVRSLTIDDSHILMAEGQIEQEFKTCIQMAEKMFKAFHLKDYYVRLSLADPSDAVKYISDEKTWQKAGQKLEKVIKENRLQYKIAKGEASFYGPKIDYIVKDCLGREWQMTTLQLDLFMAKKLNLIYIDPDGREKHPVILHRGLTGSIERTLGILIEHFNAAFPIWLSPIQVIIIPITDQQVQFCQNISQKLKAQNIRVELDQKNETMQKKIKEAEEQKIPYMLIIGNREVKENTISVRQRANKSFNQLTLDQFMAKINKEIEEKI